VRRAIIIVLTGLLSHTLCAAESNPQDKVISAAKRLSDAANYSWAATITEGDGTRFGPIEGKADATGLMHLSFEIGGVPVEVYMNGKKGAGKVSEGWQTFDEIAQTGGIAAALVRQVRSYKTPSLDLTALGEKMNDFKEDEGIITAQLKEDAAKERLQVFAPTAPGQRTNQLTNVKGSVRFWTREGALIKYELRIQGHVTWGENESDLDRTTTTEIKNVGKTKLELPAEAKQKML
jgi:hypothetical protein